MTRARPRPGLLKLAAFATLAGIVACAVLVLLAEGGFRVRQRLKYGMWSVEATYTTDPETGLRIPIPNTVTAGIRINSLGFRGPDLAVPKPAGTVRLAFLGGSTTFSAEASSNETTWPHLVWRALADAFPARRLDYVNAGVPGLAVAHLRETLRLRVAALAPDVIVIYEATNDLSADTRGMARAQGLLDGQPVNETSWLGRHSLLWFLVEKNLALAALQREADRTRRKLEFDARELSRAFERRLTDLVRDSQRVAPVVAVVTFSSRLRRDQSPTARKEAAVTALYYMPYMTPEGVLKGFEQYNEVIRAVAVATGALSIEGEDEIPADGVHYNDSVHFTDAGSRVMAARVSRALLASPSVQRVIGVPSGS